MAALLARTAMIERGREWIECLDCGAGMEVSTAFADAYGLALAGVHVCVPVAGKAS